MNVKRNAQLAGERLENIKEQQEEDVTPAVANDVRKDQNSKSLINITDNKE